MVNTTAPIIIHQMGKVASQTVEASLKTLLSPHPIYRTHMLAKSTWENVAFWTTLPLPEELSEYPTSWKLQIAEGQRFCQQIGMHAEQLANGKTADKIPVITLTRDPLAITIACLFQSLTLHFSEYEARCRSDSVQNIAADLVNYFLELVNRFLAGKHLPQTPAAKQFESWLVQRPRFFDDELGHVFGIDVYNNPFEHSKGYIVVEGDFARVLVIRLEDLNRVASTAFGEFLGLDEFVLLNRNVGAEKHYSELYRQFKKTVRLPKAFVDLHYSWKMPRHFYLRSEIRRFRERWLK